MRSRWGNRPALWAGCVLAAIAAAATPCARAAGDARILYFEPLRSLTPDRDTVLRKSNGAPLRELRFDAFGRRFHLSLDENTPLTDHLDAKTRSSSLHLYRGALSDVAGSWVRLSTEGSTVQGMFWDGDDLYVIEPAAQVRDSLVPPLDVAASQTVIFRLADVLIDANDATCATEAAQETSGAKQFDALLGELKGSPTIMQAAGARTRLQVTVMGDAFFAQRYANEEEARNAILVRLNNLDGIYSSQLGVEIQPAGVFINSAISEPLTSSSSPDSLLQDLARLRKRSPNLLAGGLTHLFTGRDLSGETVGIAYMNRLCHAEYAVGLTEARTGNAWRDSLITAHEVGHIFGASHDGDSQGACPLTQTGAYVMSSTVSGSDQFSPCSLNTMQAKVVSASCLTALPAADLWIPTDLGETPASVGRTFEWRIDVRNIGGAFAERVSAEVLVPPTMLVDDAYVVGGSCTSGAGLTVCQLGDLAGGATRAVNLTLRSDVVGSNSISARVAAGNDAVPTNNAGAGSLLVRNEADVSLSLQGPSSAVVAGEFRVSFATTNTTSVEASNLAFTLDLPPTITASEATFAGSSCSASAGAVHCLLTSLPGGAAAQGSATLIASGAGAAALKARIAGAYIDPTPANDSAEIIVNIAGDTTAVASPVSPESQRQQQKSGGGALPGWLLLALAAFCGVHREARLTRHPG